MGKNILLPVVIALFTAFIPVYAIAEKDQCDFDGDGDIDGYDLSVFAEKFGSVIWYKDSDGDRYSDGNTQYSATRPIGYYPESELTSITGDCDDGNPTINPDAEETTCDSLDNNCDGQVDEGLNCCLTDDDCGLCKKCSDGDCVNQPAGEDSKGECTMFSCTNYLYGWSGSSCRRFAGSTTLNGACNGSGVCASITQSCVGIGTVTVSCGSVGCTKQCPTGALSIDYDSIAEVCFTDFVRHGCAEGLVCDPSGTCN